jgi:hypothetical protein
VLGSPGISRCDAHFRVTVTYANTYAKPARVMRDRPILGAPLARTEADSVKHGEILCDEWATRPRFLLKALRDSFRQSMKSRHDSRWGVTIASDGRQEETCDPLAF